MTNWREITKPKMKMDKMHVIKMAIELEIKRKKYRLFALVKRNIYEIYHANPFKILSAYLTTTATIRPPKAFKATRYHTKRSYPKKKLV